MKHRNSVVVLALAVATLVLALAIVMSALAPSTELGTTDDLVIGDRSGVALRKLEQQLAERDATIARLQSRLDAAEARVTLSTAPPPAEERTSVVAEASPHGPGSHVSLTQWLQHALPDMFAALTAEQAAAITDLDLRGAPITDADLALLPALPMLRKLSLRGTAVTDAGLSHLAALDLLESLDLRGTAVTAAGLTQLPANALTALHLTDTKVTGSELYHVPAFRNVATLKLNSLSFGDEHVDALAGYVALQHLELDRTAITDAGLQRLLQINPRLRRVELRGTPVTHAFLEQLRARYPECVFVTEDPLTRVR